MYNGIGLTTPRGSGTNGYIQTNKFFIKPRSSSSTAPYDADAPPAVGGVRKPNKDILEHDRKRRIELRLLSLREALADQGYTEDEVEEKVTKTRNALEEEAREKEKDGDRAAMPPPSKRFSDTQSHQIAARKQKQLEVFRSALGIKQDFESSDHELQEESQQEKPHSSESEKCNDEKAREREKGSGSQNINRNGKQSLDKVGSGEDFKDLKQHGEENKHGNNSTNDSMEDGEIRASVRSIKEGSKHRKSNNKDVSDSDSYSGKENATKGGEKSVKKQNRDARIKRKQLRNNLTRSRRYDSDDSMTDKRNNKEVQTDHHRDGKMGRDHESWIESSKIKQALGSSSGTERKNGKDVKIDHCSYDYDKRSHLGYQHKTARNDSLEPRRDGDRVGRGSQEDRKRKVEDAGISNLPFRESRRPITDIEPKARESHKPASYGRSQDYRREDHPNPNRYEDKHESRGRTKDEQRYNDTKRRRDDDSPQYVFRDRHARNHDEDSADRHATRKTQVEVGTVATE